MTDTSGAGAPQTPFSKSTEITAVVSLAHAYSHFIFFVLPPLFPLLYTDLSVSYTELGALIVAFNVVSALTQLPMGVLVDRLDAPKLLTAAVAVQGLALIVMGLVPSYWVLMAMMIPTGLANAVYHPADYAILNRSVDPAVMGRTFSIHTVSGFAGSAIAPLTMVALAASVGWQWAMVAVGLAGVLIAAVVLRFNDLLTAPSKETHDSEEPKPNASFQKTTALLLSLPILMGFVFWMFIAVVQKGVANFSVAAFDQMYGMTLMTANAALTAYLAASSAGILLGGYLGDRTDRHDLIAIYGSAVAGLAIFALSLSDLSVFAIMTAMAVSGFASGVTAPSRDLLVRAVAPKESMGTVFGFVSTGLNVGGIAAPFVFGWLLDSNQAASVFVIAGAFQVAIVLTVFGMKAASQSAQEKVG